jgi:hypothetical protein
MITESSTRATGQLWGAIIGAGRGGRRALGGEEQAAFRAVFAAELDAAAEARHAMDALFRGPGSGVPCLFFVGQGVGSNGADRLFGGTAT